MPGGSADSTARDGHDDDCRQRNTFATTSSVANMSDHPFVTWWEGTDADTLREHEAGARFARHQVADLRRVVTCSAASGERLSAALPPQT